MNCPDVVYILYSFEDGETELVNVYFSDDLAVSDMKRLSLKDGSFYFIRRVEVTK